MVLMIRGLPSILVFMILAFCSTAAHATPAEFAAQEIGDAAKAASVAAPRVIFRIDGALEAQAYRLNRRLDGTIVVTGGGWSEAVFIDIARIQCRHPVPL